LGRNTLIALSSLALAGGSGFFASQAISGATQAPTKTVTLDVGSGTGATGPQGPAGPPGPRGATGPAGSPGAESCPSGYAFGAVVFNTPGGHTTIATCIAD